MFCLFTSIEVIERGKNSDGETKFFLFLLIYSLFWVRMHTLFICFILQLKEWTGTLY